MTGQADTRSTAAAVEFRGLLALLDANGDVIGEVGLAELSEINEIRQIVIDAGEVRVSYTGS
jgi:hypothetical protein